MDAELLLTAVVLIVALIGGGAGGLVLLRKSGNPDSILGSSHETVQTHMDFRYQEHSEMKELLGRMDEKLGRLEKLDSLEGMSKTLESIERRLDRG